jgi:uncharacterized protein YsxB (DUF464 family)
MAMSEIEQRLLESARRLEEQYARRQAEIRASEGRLLALLEEQSMHLRQQSGALEKLSCGLQTLARSYKEHLRLHGRPSVR